MQPFAVSEMQEIERNYLVPLGKMLSMASVDCKPRTIFRLPVHTFLVIFFHCNILVFNQRLHTEMYVYTHYIPFILLLIVPIEILHTHTYPIGTVQCSTNRLHTEIDYFILIHIL